MMDGARVPSGLRPKKRKKVDEASSPSSSTITVIHAEQTITRAPIQRVYRRTSSSIDRLCEILLPWNILHQLKGNEGSDATSKLPKLIPVKFPSHSDYYDTLEPILLDEMKANIVQQTPLTRSSNAVRYGDIYVNNNETIDTLSCLVRLTCTFEDKDSSYTSMTEVDKGSSLVDGDKGVSLTDGDNKQRDSLGNMDLILFTEKAIKLPITAVSLAEMSQHDLRHNALGLVTQKGDGGTLQVKVDKSTWNSFKSIVKIQRDSDQPEVLQCKKKSKDYIKLHYIYVDSLISSWREFMALHDCYISPNLLTQLLGGNVASTPPTTSISLSTDVATSSGLTKKYLQILDSTYNSSQVAAIHEAIINTGFTLVEGPPGTGKTATVLGILNSIHIREYNKYYSTVLEAVLGDEGMSCRKLVNGFINENAWLKLIARLSKAKPHILVVAPSNIAVDNVIQRIMVKGFTDGKGGSYNPSILRIGAGKSSRVKTVSLEDSLEQEEMQYRDEATRTVILQNVMRDIRELLPQVYAEQSYLLNMSIAFNAHPMPSGWELRVSNENAQPYWVNHKEKTTSLQPPPIPAKSTRSTHTLSTLPEYAIHACAITQLLDQLDKLNLILTRHRARTSPHLFGGYTQAKQLIETHLIDDAHIVFTTLNSSGHPCMESTEFCVTVIDEAAQCVEPAVLIPLRRGCKQCIMVGDPKQLQATLFSNRAKHIGYGRSLFERLLLSGKSSTLLDTQYRMHPDISRFPSKAFYSSQLKDGRVVKDDKYIPVYMKTTYNCGSVTLPSFLLFNLLSSQEQQADNQSLSRCNKEEAIVCAKIVLTLMIEAFKANTVLGSVGIITPYSDQVREIRSQLSLYKLKDNKSMVVSVPIKNNASTLLLPCPDIEVNTVDGFQGKEKDIIIISCVRANEHGNLGFLSDPRRMNVALTRGRHAMYVVGAKDTLQKDALWGQLITHAIDEVKIVDVPNSGVTTDALITLVINNIIASHHKLIHPPDLSLPTTTTIIVPEQHQHQHQHQQQQQHQQQYCVTQFLSRMHDQIIGNNFSEYSITDSAAAYSIEEGEEVEVYMPSYQ